MEEVEDEGRRRARLRAMSSLQSFVQEHDWVVQAALSNLSGRARARLKVILARIEQEQACRMTGLNIDGGAIGFIRD